MLNRLRLIFHMQKGRTENYLILLLISFFVLCVFSTSSFLYNINPWSDANIFFTIGRGILHGKKLYIDLFDHKGPLLYLIYVFAAIISETSFVGVLVIEVISFSFFLLLTQKLLSIYKEGKYYFSLLFISILICTSNAFNYGGGSAEEFILPFFTLSLYLSLKTIHCGKSFSNKTCWLIGICMFSVFFIKFNLCGFYIGLAIALLFYQYHIDKKRCMSCVLQVLCAFIILSAIACIIMLYCGIFQAFIDVYFGFNLFSYTVSKSRIIILLWAFSKALAWFVKNNLISMTAVLSGGLFFLITIKKKYERLLLIVTLVCWYALTMIGGRSIYYYIFPIFMYYFTFVLMLNKCKKKTIVKVSCAATCIISICLCQNTYRIGENDTVQNDLTSIMNEYSDSPSLLVFHGYDEGFYLKNNYIPSCKYFTNINAKVNDFEDITMQCITNNKYDFLISMSNDLKNPPILDIDGYTLLAIERSKYLYDGKVKEYYLYISDYLMENNSYEKQ